MQTICSAIDREYVTELLPNRPPEANLLVAILERALRDIQAHAEPQIRQKAISWFRSTRRSKISDNYFGFLDIVEYLGIGAKEIELIYKHIEEGEKHQEDYLNGVYVQETKFFRRRVK